MRSSVTTLHLPLPLADRVPSAARRLRVLILAPTLAQRDGMKIRLLLPTFMPVSGSSELAAAITALYRYPVKGLSAEPLARVGLEIGQCLPHHRRFAIALG